ncbi:MAG: carbamoyl-phosphate synthase large subunit [Bacteriovoracaceae bacterium]
MYIKTLNFYTPNELEFIKQLKRNKVYLHFEDGTVFNGYINLKEDDLRLKQGIWGEAAFTTALTGYQETLTDPSFLGQHIIFATPHIGNYPSNPDWSQSKKVHATAAIARYFSPNEFFLKNDIPLVSNVDTRKLVKYLTQNSHHNSLISLKSTTPSVSDFKNAKIICNELSLVSNDTPVVIIPGENPIVVINYGIKKSIIDHLKELNFPMVMVSHKTSFEQIVQYKPRLIFLSNGPGDPSLYKEEYQTVRELIKAKYPIRAICLGHQLVSLALKAKTFKLPFGHRGTNHPVLNHYTGKVLITSQNHGHAVDNSSLKQVLENNEFNKKFFVHYSSLFDNSIEGLSSSDHTIKTVQFHPEASPGPHDSFAFFTEIKDYLTQKNETSIDLKALIPKPKTIDMSQNNSVNCPYKKILIIGSGPIKIGEASEFDYSGTQACQALKKQGIEVVLVNSNPATIMTDIDLAYKTYIEPITIDTIKKIIKKERVDAVLSTMGGQTALNLSIELDKSGFLKDNNVTLLGANAKTIEMTEDREIFSRELETLGYKTGKRIVVNMLEEAIICAQNAIGYPLLIRRNFALGGQGAVFIHNQAELEKNLKNSDITFPLTLEKSLIGYKEVELEVMIDCEKNGVIICTIENIDPCGIHTGDSITVAPAQTISDYCLQKLRTMSLTIAKHVGVVAGGANVQFAINPFDEDDIIVIEMNPRVSRSSALASKATGYPIAKISTLLAIGYTLKEILNDITKVSPVSFEPTLDYVAIKVPIFPFHKFPYSSNLLGPQMRSVGEVLALGSSFNEAFLKALRSLELNLEIPSLTQLPEVPITLSEEYILNRLSNPQELSLLTALEALRLGIAKEKIFLNSKISPWFIEQIDEICKTEGEIFEKKNRLLSDPQLFTNFKAIGFSDKFIAKITGLLEKDILSFRINNKIFPVYKAVDTCSGEFVALTPYFYSTFQTENDSKVINTNKQFKNSIVILGSGPNRIGQGIEFDYSCVKASQRLKAKNYASIMVNSNPETVSTDYDSSDKLYLSPLYAEDLFDILFYENPLGVIACFSGQTGIKLRKDCEQGFRKNFYNFNFLGSKYESLELTEDRGQFDLITKSLRLSKTKSKEVQGYHNLIDAIIEIGFPVIIRPSFVIGGESMFVFYSHQEIEELPIKTLTQLKSSSVTYLVENFLEDSIEYDVDLVRDQFNNIVFCSTEHIEYAGVHSGDSGMLTPTMKITPALKLELYDISKELAAKLEVIGPINIQYAIQGKSIFCIEANPRGSRTIPFLSKAHNINLAGLAVDAILGERVAPFTQEDKGFYCVKQSTFPFDRFIKDDIILGPKMRSTGETFGVDYDKDAAILKSLLANYPKLNRKGKVLLSLNDSSKVVVIPYIKQLIKIGFELFATKGTADFIKKLGCPCSEVQKLHEHDFDTSTPKVNKHMLTLLKDENLVMVLNTPVNTGLSRIDGEVIRNNSIQCGVPCFTRKENIQMVLESLIGCDNQELVPYSLQEIHKRDNNV